MKRRKNMKMDYKLMNHINELGLQIQEERNRPKRKENEYDAIDDAKIIFQIFLLTIVIGIGLLAVAEWCLR